MRQTKIVEIVKTFDEKEWRACHKYLKYSSQKTAKSLQIFEYLLRYRKKLNSSRLDRKFLLGSVFLGLGEKTFLNRLSDLVKDVEEFMVHKHLQRNENSYDFKILLSEVYKKKGLSKNFQKVLKGIQNDLVGIPAIELFGHLKVLQIHHSLYFSDYYDRYSKPLESLMEAEKRIEKLSKNLTSFYRTERLNFRNLHKEERIDKVVTIQDELSILLDHYRRLTTSKDEKSYSFLRNMILTRPPSISLELNQAILLTLLNFCFYKIREGDIQKKEELANLYLFGLNSALLLQNGSLSEIRFLNIVDVISNSSISINYQDFINRWVDKIVTDDRRSVKNVALAMYAFAHNDFNLTLRILSGYDIYMTRINHAIRSRWMQICSLCSLYKDYEQKEEILGATNIYFKRHREEISDHTYKGSINLLKVVKMFWYYTDHLEIIKFVDNCDFVVHRMWIDKMLEKKAFE